LLGYSSEPGQEDRQLSFPGATIREDGTAVYQVVEGDTPIGIATRYGLTLDELFQLNNDITSESILRIGQQIIVGRLPIPEEVGGSTDMPTSTAISRTITVEPSETATTIVEIVTPTRTPTPEPSVTPGDVQNDGTSAGGIEPILVLIFIGIVLLLAAIGGFFLYLGRNRET
jgi:hypothetical protein